MRNPVLRVFGAALYGLMALAGAHAQNLSGPALIQALQGGGYVLVMRHASSPPTPPTDAEALPDNRKRERQLDETGRLAASAVGAAIRSLNIPIGQVWSSPTYRALETVRLLGLPAPRTAAELGDGGQSMQAVGSDQSAWLKAKVAQPPRPGTDTLIVTQLPNITAAFGPAANGIAAGEALVFHPRGDGHPEVVARIKIEDWPAVAEK
jgi:hypothetical protein